MKNVLTSKVPVFLIAVFVAICTPPLSYCQAQTGSQPDVVIRIAGIEQTMNIIDEVFASETRQSGHSPSAKLRGMLMGTQWIDPGRALVIGANFDKEQVKKMPDMGLLVPFKSPNKDFASAYGAEKKEDYYLVALQQGKTAHVSPQLASALAEASKKPGGRFVSVDIAASRLIGKAEQQIQQLIETMEKEMAAARQNSADTAPAGQTGMMMEAFLELGRQVETLSFGGDIDRKNAVFSTEILAMADSEIAGLMTGTQDSPEGRLGNITPDANLQIQFQSRPYDIAASTGFMTDYFGEFYKSMGFDMDKAAEMFSFFTGEMVGAMSLDPPDIRMEMVTALTPGRDLPEDFLESQLIPWLMEAGKQTAQSFREQYPDHKFDSIVTRTANSTIDGNTVAGIQARLPVIDPETRKEVHVLRLPIRMTILNDCLLTASDDARLKSLIQKVSDFKPADSKGPLITMTVDLGGVMKAAAAMNSGKDAQSVESIPDLGDLVYTVKLQDRRMQAEYTMNTEDIRRFVDSVEAMQKKQSTDLQAPPSQQSSGKSFSEFTSSEKTLASASQPEMRSSGPAGKQENKKSDQTISKDDAQYWMDKGGLYASYGNQDAAIKSFKKALELDPGNTRAAFNLGVVYAENGEYDKALDFINRAVSSEPKNGNYLYGRGWVHMLAGRDKKAIEDIGRAAELGNPDALKYMDSIAPRQKGDSTQHE
ncbi:MAG: tetratricopeptide repeat protein [Desulfobacteraceae bacterium]|nr:tetratricopeptide repeat protein [Desulfobacteraceae bacterium]